MKSGAGLFVIGAGAILAFAVTATPSWLNLHVAGWVLMIVGIAGLLIPKRGYSWIGRRMFVRRTERRPGRVEHVSYPPYAGLPPGVGPDPIPEYVPGETEVTEDVYEE